MRDSLTMDFNALDLLASTAVLQTRDSDNSGSTGSNHQDDKSDGTSEPSAESDEDANKEVKSEHPDETMGTMKEVRKSSISPEILQVLPKEVLTNNLPPTSESDTLSEESVLPLKSDDVTKIASLKPCPMGTDELSAIENKSEGSDTDSCLEDNDVVHSEDSTSGPMNNSSGDKMGKSKTIMRSLLTGQTISKAIEEGEDVDVICCDSTVNCDDQVLDHVSVLGSNQSSEESNSASKQISLSEKTNSEHLENEVPMEITGGDDSTPVQQNESNVSENKLEKSSSLQDSVLDSSDEPMENSSSPHSESDALHFVMTSDHCYASVPGKTTNHSFSYLERFDGEDHESDSGIDGNSSSEEAEHRTRSLSLDSNCLHCGYTELSGRSSRLLSQGSDFDRSPMGNLGCHLGLSVLSPTLSSSDSQCSDYHHGNNLVENVTIQKYDSDSLEEEKKYKTVDFDLDNNIAGTSEKGDTSGHDFVKVGKFRIGKFASFTNIEESDTDKLYTRDSFALGYGVSSASSVGMPASPGIPSLLQSPCGDWDRSDAGSEALDDNMDSIPPTPEEPKELSLLLQGNKPLGLNSICLTVNHDHDYCFRGGSLPVSPLGFDRKAVKGEKRKYMTAARSRGTNLYLKEPKTKTVKLKNKKGLSETIEKVKNSLATSAPVALDCNFKKPEQPVNSTFDKTNPTGRPKRRLEKEEESEIELDSGSKLKITGKFQNDFVYFLTKTSRNRRRASVEKAVTDESGKLLQPAKPIDIIVPHLTDEDLEVLQTKGRAGLAMLEKFSANPQLLDRFSATLQSQCKNSATVDNGVKVLDKNNGMNQVTTESFIDDDKIINTILSMENDNLGSPVSREADVTTDMDFYNCEGETINLMGENMTLTPDQVDLLLNAVKDVSTSEEFIESPEKMCLDSPADEIETCEHQSFSETDQSCDSCCPSILDNNPVEVSNPEWEVKKESTMDNDDTESTYSSSDIGHSSVSDMKEDSQESFELKEGDVEVEEKVKQCAANPDPDLVTSNLSNNMCDKSLTLDNDLNSLDLANTKPDKSLLDSELNGFSNTLGTTLPDLSLPLEKSFELLGSDFRLDKPDDLFPEANVDPAPQTPQQQDSSSDYNNTPWVVTVTIYWNDLPAIMINNKPFLRLVDIHKQILPAKDTGILKKRCQLLSITVMNCSEMQRYFLVQYGRGYNSKSTLIVSKDDACQLVGYYAQPQPRVARVEENTVIHKLSHTSKHMALTQPSLPSPQPRMSRKKRSGSRASKNTSPERKENAKTPSAPPSPKVPKPVQIHLPTVVSKRLRHKKINFLEMLKGDSVQEKVAVHIEDSSEVEKKTMLTPPSTKKKGEFSKKANGRVKRKEEELVEVATENLNCSTEDDPEHSEKDLVENEGTSAPSEEDLSENKSKRRKSTNNKVSPTNGKKSQSKKLGPLRVSVKGLLHFQKTNKKGGMIKNDPKSLEVVHTAQEIKDGQIPISQNGTLQLELYKKKSSLCVRCVDCHKLLSVQSFLSHQHYPEDDKTLTTVLEIQTLSPKSEDLSRNLKSVWEDFQLRREKFEGYRFPKPTKSVVVLKNNVEPVVKNKKSGLILDMSTTVVLDEEDSASASQNTSGDCETVLVNSLPGQSEIGQDAEETLSPTQLETIQPTDDATQADAPTLDLADIAEVETDSKTASRSNAETSSCLAEESDCSFTSQNSDFNIAADALDKFGVRSSSRKRKSRQYFSFEDYSFSNKKTRVDDVECKGGSTSV